MKIPGWSQTRKDAGATVWIREKPTDLRIVVVGVKDYSGNEAWRVQDIIGWDIVIDGSGMKKKISYGVRKTRKEAEKVAVALIKKSPGVTERFKPAKGNVGKIEKKARELMRGKFVRGEKLPMLYYYILEDANFHNENTALTKAGVFGEYETHHYDSGDVVVPKGYSGDDAEYKAYRAAGGRTWEL